MKIIKAIVDIIRFPLAIFIALELIFGIVFRGCILLPYLFCLNWCDELLNMVDEE